MDTLKLISVKRVADVSEMSQSQIQIWTQFILSKYGIQADSPADFFEKESEEFPQHIEPSIEDFQFQAQYVSSKSGNQNGVPSHLFDSFSSDEDEIDAIPTSIPEDTVVTIPVAEEIVTRVWEWTSPNGNVYTLVDACGWMMRWYEGVILMNGSPRIDNDNMELKWIGESIQEFDLELFAAIRIFLYDSDEYELEEQEPETPIDEMALEFLREHPEFVTMEVNAKVN